MNITEDHIRQSNLIEGVTDEAEIGQSWIAWNLIKDHPGPLNEFMVLELHSAIMMNFLLLKPGGRGSYRLTNVTVGGRDCPHWRDVPTLMDEWLTDLTNTPRMEHIRFEHIHPFIDGNGRTGRMLMW